MSFIKLLKIFNYKAITEDNSPQDENQLDPLLKESGLDEGEGVDAAQEESPDQSISSAMPIEGDGAPIIQDGMICCFDLHLHRFFYLSFSYFQDRQQCLYETEYIRILKYTAIIFYFGEQIVVCYMWQHM